MRHEFEHDGRLISYLDARPAGPRQAGVVVLLHAFPLAAEMWAPQLAAVPGGWHFVAPDLRGFGHSAPDAHHAAWTDAAARSVFSMDDYARDVLALLDHLRAAEAIVCGLSMGGYVSLALWRLAPRRIRGFVLADTRPDADTGEVRAGRERMLETLACRGVQAVAEGMVGRLLGPTSLASRPPVVERVRQIAASQRAEAVGPAIARLMTRPDSTELLPGIDCPVLVVAGREDEITPPDVAQQMHGQLADASLALIGHAGHLSSLEQPEAFSAALDRFLAARFLQA